MLWPAGQWHELGSSAIRHSSRSSHWVLSMLAFPWPAAVVCNLGPLGLAARLQGVVLLMLTASVRLLAWAAGCQGTLLLLLPLLSS